MLLPLCKTRSNKSAKSASKSCAFGSCVRPSSGICAAICSRNLHSTPSATTSAPSWTPLMSSTSSTPCSSPMKALARTSWSAPRGSCACCLPCSAIRRTSWLATAVFPLPAHPHTTTTGTRSISAPVVAVTKPLITWPRGIISSSTKGRARGRLGRYSKRGCARFRGSPEDVVTWAPSLISVCLSKEGISPFSSVVCSDAVGRSAPGLLMDCMDRCMESRSSWRRIQLAMRRPSA